MGWGTYCLSRVGRSEKSRKPGSCYLGQGVEDQSLGGRATRVEWKTRDRDLTHIRKHGCKFEMCELIGSLGVAGCSLGAPRRGVRCRVSGDHTPGPRVCEELHMSLASVSVDNKILLPFKSSLDVPPLRRDEFPSVEEADRCSHTRRSLRLLSLLHLQRPSRNGG